MLAKITNIYHATILISEKCLKLRVKNSCLLLIVIAFFTAVILLTPAFPSAFAHGVHQPSAADFEGKKASLFVKLDPPVVTDISQPIFINARFFD
jgi:hypothetical protein